ncbi:MAG: hypothetical protein C0617_00860 [Desulfuromonas sp.]|nr:MAG: hypothetical protein C0617_00860 [Desulfuromonas sp.]
MGAAFSEAEQAFSESPGLQEGEPLVSILRRSISRLDLIRLLHYIVLPVLKKDESSGVYYHGQN